MKFKTELCRNDKSKVTTKTIEITADCRLIRIIKEINSEYTTGLFE